MTQHITINATDARIAGDGQWGVNVTLTGMKTAEVVGEFNVEEVLGSLTANGHFGRIVEFIAKETEEDE